MKKIALLLTGSLCSFGMSFSTYGLEQHGLTDQTAQIYLDLLQKDYKYSFVTSHISDVTGDGFAELFVTYDQEEGGISTDIWQILEGELSPIVFEHSPMDSLSIVTDEQGNSYLFAQSSGDALMSEGTLYQIYSYKEGGISPIYQLSRMETFFWNEEEKVYDTSTPLEVFTENGVPVQETPSFRDLFEEMTEKFQLDDQILIYEEGLLVEENVPSAVGVLEEIVRQGKYKIYDNMNCQELLTQLPFSGQISEIRLTTAQATAFLEVLQEKNEEFEELVASKMDSSGKTEVKQSLLEEDEKELEEIQEDMQEQEDVYVAFFKTENSSLGMWVEDTIYTWNALAGVQEVVVPEGWDFRVFENENHTISTEFYLSSPENTYFYTGSHGTFRNGFFVDTGYKSFQWTSEETSYVSQVIFDETGVNLSEKLEEVAGKSETLLGEELFQLHFHQEQMVDTLPFHAQDRVSTFTKNSQESPKNQEEFMPYQDVIALLERIVKTTEQYEGFLLVEGWEELLQPMSNDLFQDFPMDMEDQLCGVYFLCENLFYVMFQEGKDEYSGMIVGEGSQDGYPYYYLIDGVNPIKSEEELQLVIRSLQNQSNISIDYEKMAECVTKEDFLLLLEESLAFVSGSTVNVNGLKQITQYIELALEQIGGISVGAKDNYYPVNSAIFQETILQQQELASDFNALLLKNQLQLPQTVKIVSQIVVQNIDANEPIHLHLEDVVENDLRILFPGTSYQIFLEEKYIPVLLTENGFSIRLIPEKTGVVSVQFEDGMGKIISKLEVPVELTLESNTYFSTVFFNDGDGLLPWGGQYNGKNKTLTFSTYLSGKFEILDNSMEISDISHLDDPSKDAIIYMTSKGFFDTNKGNFNPNEPVTANELAQILSTLFYVTDSTLGTSFQDMEESDPFYPYVASVEKYNLLSGYTETKFFGERTVTVEQVLVSIARTLWEEKGSILPEYPEDYYFNGLFDANDWAQPFLALAYQEGIILSGEEISPDEPLTRLDAARYFYRLFQILHPNSPVVFPLTVEWIEIPVEEPIAPEIPQGGIAPVKQEVEINEKEFAMAAGTGLGLVVLLGVYRIIHRKKRKSKKKTSIIMSMDEIPEHIIDLEEVVSAKEESAIPTYQEKNTNETAEDFKEETVQEEDYQEEVPAPEETTIQNETFVPPVVYPPENTEEEDTQQLYQLEAYRPHIQVQLLVQSTVPSGVDG